MARREHFGPLRVQRDLYPEGEATCHTIIVHPPGGIAGGDALTLNARLGDGSAALLTTPGAGKWYRTVGPVARQSLNFELGAGAVLEWLPPEGIVFNGAVAETATTVRLQADALYLGWDVVCFGRAASGERFASGSFSTRTEIFCEGRRLWLEQGRMQGSDPLFDSPLGMAGHSVCGTLLAAGRLPDGEAGRELLAACRRVGVDKAALAGVTRLPGVLIARWLGDSAEDARAYFAEVWAKLRPALKKVPALAPRIWAT